MRLYSDLFTSSNGVKSFDAEINWSIYSNPEGVGKDPVMFGNGNKPPWGVKPKNAVYRSLFEKLF